MSQPIDITIPAAVNGKAGVYPLHARGKYFKCTATTGAFRLHTDNGDDFAVNQPGDGFGGATSKEYGKISFYNDGAAPVVATIYASLEPISAATTAVTSNITTTANMTNTMANCAEVVPNQFARAATIAQSPRKLTDAQTFFRWALISAKAGNAGDVNIGFANGAGNQPFVLAPNDQFIVPIPTGAKVDFQNLFLTVANDNDGVIVVFF